MEVNMPANWTEWWDEETEEDLHNLELEEKLEKILQQENSDVARCVEYVGR
jgi:hypothetical protein